MEIDSEDYWRQLAEKQWAKPQSKTRKVRVDVVKNEIWDVLEKQNFEFRSLLNLENLQLLEKYLWPGYTEESSNYHAILIALMVTVKRREGLPVWDVFSSDPVAFSSFFRRILALSVDVSLTLVLRNQLLAFLIVAFQSLDNGIVRKECAPLVSISVWNHLEGEKAREAKFEEHTQLRKAWRAAIRRYEAADELQKARIDFERSWLYSMISGFLNILYSSEDFSTDALIYCERFLEFLTDIESQLPTRRYVNSLIQDMNLLALIRNSPPCRNEANGLLRDLVDLLQHFVQFPINDNTGSQLSRDEIFDHHRGRLAILQRTALKYFKSQLTILALSNYGAIDQRSQLEENLGALTDIELLELASRLGFRTSYPQSIRVPVSRQLLLELLILNHERPKNFQESIKALHSLPTEVDLYNPSLLRNEAYDGSRSLAIPKLNLQYLTVGDFLWRSYVLFRSESFFEIRNDMEETVQRLKPGIHASGDLRLDGFSRMALKIPKPGILEIAAPRVGDDKPAYVRAEITLDLGKVQDNVRQEWDSLRPKDIVFLLSVKPQQTNGARLNGISSCLVKSDSGIQCLRAAEVVQILGESGRVIRDGSTQARQRQSRIRRLIVNIDAVAFSNDEQNKSTKKQDIYESMNIIVRRKGRENNFQGILESIKSLTLSDIPVPAWLQEVFLGYGDPSGATYTNLSNRLASIDFRDTFLNWQHLVKSFPGKILEPDEKQSSSFPPPYILEHMSITPEQAARPSKKRRRDEKDAAPPPPQTQTIKISSYTPPNTGPYPSDAPKTNRIPFTPAQVEAIISGTQPGLTVIVGPPGTGKTDVATQIINNIYHDFPNQRTLMIAHSNQALNQLFQKITKLDIDDRHLLRLGHGEEELETEISYGKQGRVESFLDNRAQYLYEVDRLAANLGARGAHGNSCETAGYFNSVYVSPAWKKFWSAAEASSFDAKVMKDSFPFYPYFSNAPQPLFPPDASEDEISDIARGCQSHIDRIFSELEDIRPFEILRHSRDRSNYLLIKEARIIAMTSTHAAMRRQEIADLSFHYDNVIMEEAAQITEIENFIPFALQAPKDGNLQLQRIVLCGDHLQNSPVVQNLAFRQYANLEQSLFLRLVRLGVPVINLDQQGRARPSIAELYRWRYKDLGDLPNVVNDPEYLQANAGLRFDFQFIDVPDYKGAGEKQPSPHFIQNLGEAEYAVALYQYMRLLGYPASSISILTTYAGQRALIKDVLNHRCARNRLFGLPRIVTTVDKYQGEQNDYVILSLVRTNRVGYLRDIRRLTVALSRARLGLYILGRKAIFESCYELKEAFERLLKRPTTLMVVPGEMHPTTRKVDEEVEATEMTGVEHLGQYVYEMTQAKIKQLEAGTLALPPIEEAIVEEEQEVDEVTGEEFDQQEESEI